MMKKAIVFFAAIIALVAGMLSFKMNSDTAKPEYYYVKREPKIPSEKPPLLILLHGYRSNEQDLFSFANALPDEFLVVSPRGPLEYGSQQYAWYEVQFKGDQPNIDATQAENARTGLIRFIDDLRLAEKFDPQRVYLMGFSQGGILSYSVGLTAPDKTKGIAVMSGRLLPEIKSKIAPAESLKNLRVFIGHGTQDQVIKVQQARDAASQLRLMSLTPESQEYPIAHSISDAEFQDFLVWLKKK